MLINRIFEIQNLQDFEVLALEVFRYQYLNTTIYQNYVDFLNVDISEVDSVKKIPFLPIEIYKNHKILSKQLEKTTNKYFESSGTTALARSKHWIADTEIYEKSIRLGFEKFIGNPQEITILALLPNYSENPNSSLIYMVDYLMQISNQPDNAYFLYNHHALNQKIIQLEKQNKNYCLFGVSFALLDFLDDFQPKISSGIVIETGGMKGRKTEMTKPEVLKLFKEKFQTSNIFSEYSMTELLSQAYSRNHNKYESPSWLHFYTRSLDDPFHFQQENTTGAINIIDLANLYSCSFIATQDLGKINDGQLEVLGRIDHSDIRGCSQLVL